MSKKNCPVVEDLKELAKVNKPSVKVSTKLSKNLEVKFLGVTTPGRLLSISDSEKIPVGEVMVRLSFEHGTSTDRYTVSQKLRFLGKANYEKLLGLNKDDKLTINVTEDGFFYMNNEEATKEDLFSKLDKESKDNSKIKSLFS